MLSSVPGAEGALCRDVFHPLCYTPILELGNPMDLKRDCGHIDTKLLFLTVGRNTVCPSMQVIISPTHAR